MVPFCSGDVLICVCGTPLLLLTVSILHVAHNIMDLVTRSHPWKVEVFHGPPLPEDLECVGAVLWMDENSNNVLGLKDEHAPLFLRMWYW